MMCKRVLPFLSTLLISILLISPNFYGHKRIQLMLARAAWVGNTNVMRAALAFGANVNEPVQGYINPLTAAAESGNPAAIRLLLNRGARVDQRNERGYTPLMFAAGAGQAASVRELISQGADVNAVCGRETALTIALKTRHADVAEILGDAGAKE